MSEGDGVDLVSVKVVIPFRDRGADYRRAANLDVTMAWWWAYGFTPTVVDDGLPIAEPFNRHRAYNRAVEANPEADVFVFAEADMLIKPTQIEAACAMAADDIGLVVPFTQYRYLSDDTTAKVREVVSDLDAEALARWFADEVAFGLPTEFTMDDGKSIGALNVVSRKTLDVTGGFTEATKGNWYDDNIIEEGFAFLAAPTRWVEGPAVHLYHLPGHKGSHLSQADRDATRHNHNILRMLRHHTRRQDYAAVRRLMETRLIREGKIDE